MELRYIDPSAPVDITIAEPGAGASPDDFKYQPNFFYTASPVAPRQLYYAPNIALSSVFQVRA